jgi:hypothetical protein
MKIYVEDRNNIIFKKLSSNIKIIHNIEKYLANYQIINKIYSKNGLYEINENKIYNIKIISDKLEKQKLLFDKKEYTLLIDKSKTEKNNTFQIPYEHICLPLKVNTYINNNNKNLKLIIESLYDNDKNMEVRPINYYFEYNIENSVVPIEDIKQFLLQFLC